jgi:hypothetical protein
MKCERLSKKKILKHQWNNPIRITRTIDRKESIYGNWEFFVLSLVHGIDTSDRFRKSIFSKRLNCHALMNRLITRSILVYRREIDKGRA